MARVETPVEKAERAREDIRASMRRKLAGLGIRMAERELKCEECGRILLNYDPPVGRITLNCRRCGTWKEFSA